MKKLILLSLGFTLFTSLFFTNICFAQTASGKVVFSSITGSEDTQIKSINGATFRREGVKARIEMEDETSPFHNTTGYCENWIVPAGNGKILMYGSCILTDKDGDTYVVRSTMKDEIAVMQANSGTGKFTNLEGTGTATNSTPADTGNIEDCSCTRFQIKYTL